MYENWLAMENYYFLTMPSLIILGALCVAFASSLFFHITKSKMIRRGFYFFIAVLVIVIPIGLYGYRHHKAIIEKMQYANAANRDFKKSFFNVEHAYENYEKNLYRQAYLKDSFQQIGFYQSEEIIEPVDYEGFSDNRWYFRYDTSVYHVKEDQVEFVDDLEHAERVGLQFRLADPRFESIGFVPQSGIFFSYYRLPSNQKEDPIFQGTAPAQEDIVGSWITPSIIRETEAWQELEKW